MKQKSACDNGCTDYKTERSNTLQRRSCSVVNRHSSLADVVAGSEGIFFLHHCRRDQLWLCRKPGIMAGTSDMRALSTASCSIATAARARLLELERENERLRVQIERGIQVQSPLHSQCIGRYKISESLKGKLLRWWASNVLNLVHWCSTTSETPALSNCCFVLQSVGFFTVFSSKLPLLWEF